MLRLTSLEQKVFHKTVANGACYTDLESREKAAWTRTSRKIASGIGETFAKTCEWVIIRKQLEERLTYPDLNQ